MPQLLSTALPAFGFVVALLQRPQRALQALWRRVAELDDTEVRRHLARYY